jgi:hypothetical protein
MEKKIINEVTRIQELMSKKILVEGGTPTLFTKLIKFFEKNVGDDGLPFLSPSSSELKLLKAEKSLFKKFDIILDYAKNNWLIREQLIKFINAGIPPAELQKLNDFKTFLIKYSNKDKTTLKNTVNKKLDLMIPDSKIREIYKLDFDDYVDNLKPTPIPPKKIPVKKVKKVKKVKPEPTNGPKDDKMLGDEINKSIDDAFVNKKIPLKHIQRFKTEFEKAVIKEVDKIPKETIDKLNFCIKELEKMPGLERQKLVETIVSNYERLSGKKMPLRETQRIKNFLLGKNFKKAEFDGTLFGTLGAIQDNAKQFLIHWFSKCLLSTGIYGVSYAADAFAEAHGNEKAKQLMYDKGDAAWGAFFIRTLGGPFGLLYTIISDFIPSMWNSLVAYVYENKDDRGFIKRKIDSVQLWAFKGRLKYNGVLDEYINLITINSDGFPIYTYKGTQYDIYDISAIEPNKAYIIIKGKTTEDDKTFYLTGPQFKI